jgi:hypothetical protein
MKSLAVQFVGPVRRPCPERALELDASKLDRVVDLLRHLDYQEGELSSLTVRLDGRRAGLDSSLEGARQVEILIAIGGG